MKAKEILLIGMAMSVPFLGQTQILGQTQAGNKTGYKIQSSPIQTRWAKEVNPNNALTAYPRPQMVRDNWVNLNGLWNYVITQKDAEIPAAYPDQILVPFPVESALSGVKKPLLPTQNLWYKRMLTISEIGRGERLLLHFGAVDWKATIFVNGKEMGSHIGGYTAFTLDITDALTTGENELVVKVFDPTDQGIGPHGKQVLNPENIYYTPSSGIWQTVWLEKVPASYISGIYITPDIDKELVNIIVTAPAGYQVKANVMSNGTKINAVIGKTNTILHLPVKNPRLWSPGDPFLYDLEISLYEAGKTLNDSKTLKDKVTSKEDKPIDRVKSYFGMRKIGIAKDEQGIDRIFLNNKPYFNLGTLDQGFWPDGLYTAPTDEALKFDIQAIKTMGFNTIRKHIKIEPARWYYWADKLGMLVWQDLVNPNQGLPEGAEAVFEDQARETLDQLHNYPSITTWVLFNEKWGQYDQGRLTQWIKQTDPSRLVNGHSGELLYVNGVLRSPSPNAYIHADMTDVHCYPDPMISIKQPGKAQVLGEFGGIGVFIPDHQWKDDGAWGYIQEKPASLQARYTIMNQHVELLRREGLSASIYTQPFDVEGEQNGLLTYDREVVKIPLDTLRRIHGLLNPDLGEMLQKGGLPSISVQNADLIEPGILYSRMLQQYMEGSRDPGFLKKMSMMAAQAGDKTGSFLAGKTYISTLRMPLSVEDIRMVDQFTKSTRDPGFPLMNENPKEFIHELGERPYVVTMMNCIYHGEMEPLLDGINNPDWDQIVSKIKPYGPPGEEIFLRAQTIHFLNHQDWMSYSKVAKLYLEKFGVNISDKERVLFQEALEKHKN